MGIRRFVYASLALPVVLSGALALTAGSASASVKGDQPQQQYGQQDYGSQHGLQPADHTQCGDNAKCSDQRQQFDQQQFGQQQQFDRHRQPCQPHSQPVIFVKPPCPPKQPVVVVVIKPVRPVHHHKVVCTLRNSEREVQLILLQRQHHLTAAQQRELRALKQLCGQGRG